MELKLLRKRGRKIVDLVVVTVSRKCYMELKTSRKRGAAGRETVNFMVVEVSRKRCTALEVSSVEETLSAYFVVMKVSGRRYLRIL